MKEDYSSWQRKCIDRKELIAILEGLDQDELTRDDLSRIVCENNLTKLVSFDSGEWKTIFKENKIKQNDIAELLDIKPQSFSMVMKRQSIAKINIRKIENKFGIVLPYNEES